MKVVFKALGAPAKSEKCDAMEGLIKEYNGASAEADGAVAKHAAIIGCCQAIEH